MKSVPLLLVILFFNVFLSACANRGFYLSQQMPGVDKDLNVLPEKSVYLVNANGDIVRNKKLVSSKRGSTLSRSYSQKSQPIKRGLSSLEEKPRTKVRTNRIRSTLDPTHGALLLSQ